MRVQVDGRLYLAHRLTWVWFKGDSPDAVVHHKRSDKRNTIWDLENISNRENCSIEKVEASGLPVGVHWHAATGRYRAQIRWQGRSQYLGSYDTPQEASEAYQRALERVNQGLAPETPLKDYYLGTCWYKITGKWKAQISVDGKEIHIGYFTDRDDAVRARIAAEIKYLGAPLPRKKKP